MKKSKYVIIPFMALLMAFTSAEPKLSKKVYFPVSSKSKSILHGKKKYIYHHFSQKIAAVYKVNGPGELQLNLRDIVPTEAAQSASFSIKVLDENRGAKVFNVPALKKSKSKVTKGDERIHVTRAHKIKIQVPPGKHSYQVFLHNNKGESMVRSYFTAYAKPLWKEMEPAYALDKLELKYVKSGKTIPYHKITKKEGFRFTQKDSTYMRVIVRPLFDQKLLEDINLKIKLLNHTTGKVVVYNMRTFKASNVELLDADKFIPGRPVTFYIPLPKHDQQQDYEFLVHKGSDKALIRVSHNENGIS